MGNLQIEKMVLGQVSTNCYLAVNTQTKEAILVDPAADARRIEKKIKEMAVKPVAILLTHGHFDHIGAAQELGTLYDIMIYAHEEEQEVMQDSMLNLSANFGEPFRAEPDMLLSGGQELVLAGMKIRVLHTPGHTKGGVCYYLPEEGVLFSGDTLFYCSNRGEQIFRREACQSWCGRQRKSFWSFRRRQKSARDTERRRPSATKKSTIHF